MSAQNALSAVLEPLGTEIDESQVEYIAQIFQDLVNDGCFELEEWIASAGPILEDWVDGDAVVEKVCQDTMSVLQSKEASQDESGCKTDSEKKKPAFDEYEEEAAPSVDGLLVRMEDMHLGFGSGRILLMHTGLVLKKGHRYGLVGQNGSGKTTLMRRIALKDMPGFPKQVKVMFVEHEISGDAMNLTVAAFMMGAGAKLGVAVTDASVRAILDEMGFEEKMQKSPVKELSGGWRMRLAIAQAMLSKSDILCLDEPTNHLDVHAVAWLENFLANLKDVCVVMVSHEPSFLDAVVTDVILIQNQKLNTYSGNFSDFTKQQLDFSEADLKSSETGADSLVFKFPTPERLTGVASTRTVLKMHDVTFKYAQDRPAIVSNVSCKLMLVSRCAVIGENGAGKSTLIKLLVGELFPSNEKGKVWMHHNLRVSYVAQHSFFHLEQHLQETAVNYIQNRFKLGFDRESTVVKKGEALAARELTEDAAAEIEQLVARRKYKKELEYEVKYKGRGDHCNAWIPLSKMRYRGERAMQMVAELDEALRNAKSGIDQRPLIAKEVTKHLKDFGLKGVNATSKIDMLSGGQRSRLVLAAAMWNKPHLLVLDEPTNFLDQEALSALAKAIKKYRGGVIMVSHHENFVTNLCSEVWRVKAGEVVIEQKKYDSKTAAYNAPAPER